MIKDFSDMPEEELLKRTIENDIINLRDIQLKYEMNEREKYLKQHKYTIWSDEKRGKLCTYLPDDSKKRGIRLVRRNTKEELDNCIIEYYKKQENEPTVRMIFDTYIEEKLKYKEIKKQSYDKYRNNFTRFFDNSYYNMADRKMKYITEDSLEEFIKTIIVKQELTHKAFSDFKILIRGIFKYAKKKKYTSISITNFLGDLDISRNSYKKVIKRDEDEVFSEEEIPKILGYLRAENDIRSLGLLLSFETGMRIGELSALKYSDIHSKKLYNIDVIKNYISIERTEVKIKDENGKSVVVVRDYPKTKAGVRNVIISEKALQTIENIKKINPDGEYLFMYNNKRIQGRAFNKKLGRVCDNLNIAKRSTHKIRKTYGTTLMDCGVDDSVVAEMMGHRSIETTMKFYYRSNKSEKNKISQIEKAIGDI